MKVRIGGPQTLQGKIRAPRSKAYTHRALVASMLAQGKSVIIDPLISDDTVNTLDAIQELGARVHESKIEIEVNGAGVPRAPERNLDCAESGATLRFLTAIATTGSDKITFTSRTGLANRPIEPLLQALTRLGASADLHQEKDALRVTIQGPLKGGVTSISGEISSQFISGLLMAAPFARSDVTINVEGNLESKPYIDLTLAVLEKHGITAEREEKGFRISAPQEYKPASHHVPSDFSSTAPVAAGAATAGETIVLTGIDGDYRSEPDSIILDLLPKIGIKIDIKDDQLTVQKGRPRGFDFDARDHPDLVPVLEVLASQAEGKTTISGVTRLRFKESDRLNSVPSELSKMGARIKVAENAITIEGVDHLQGGTLSSHHDHRVAMACAIAALAARGDSVLEEAQVVSKSYPGFFTDLETLGAKFNVE